MIYPILAVIFFFFLLSPIFLILLAVFQLQFWNTHKKLVIGSYGLALFGYGIFVFGFTGPHELHHYPTARTSRYKLPWRAGTSRWVSQGHRSVVSHRDLHEYAWDFIMPVGSEVLAARSGVVKEVEDSWDGVGFKSNSVVITHKGGESSVYAHIQHRGSLVRVGDRVLQGQTIAYSGNVGQTLFPHLHFYVRDDDSKTSRPIVFNDVADGLPRAGRFYTSGNDGSLGPRKPKDLIR